MPLLLRQGHVLLVTGWSRQTLRKMVDNDALKVVRTSGGQRHYRKREIAEIIGMKELL